MEKQGITVDVLNDLNDLWTLEDEFRQAVGEEPMDEAARLRLEQAIADEKIVFLIAKAEEQPVGMCSLSPCFSTFACRAGAVFDDFYVLPAYRGTGTARRLVQAAAEWCRAHDCAGLTVGCSPEDEAMYGSLGFDTKLGVMLANNL